MIGPFRPCATIVGALTTTGATSMLFLILATLASAGNALTMKFAGSRSDNAWSLLFFNYIAATAISALSGARSGLVIADVEPKVWGMGLVTGVLFVTTFALLRLNVSKNGATISASLARMGSIIPLTLSIVLFDEFPTLAGWGGIIVAVVATVLLAIPPKETSGTDAVGSSTRALLIPMVLAGGIADTFPKVFEATGNPAHEEAYILMTFGTALAVCLVMLLCAHERPRGIDIACGVLLGAFNFFSTDFSVRALMELPAHIVYTGFSMGVVLVTFVVNMLIMHERLTPRDRVAIALVLLALVLINLPR